jgi:hypothetical protein
LAAFFISPYAPSRVAASRSRSVGFGVNRTWNRRSGNKIGDLSYFRPRTADFAAPHKSTLQQNAPFTRPAFSRLENC